VYLQEPCPVHALFAEQNSGPAPVHAAGAAAEPMAEDGGPAAPGDPSTAVEAQPQDAATDADAILDPHTSVSSAQWVPL